MDVDVTKTPNHSECIRCGKCVEACPTNAVCYHYGFGSGQKETKKQKLREKGETIMKKLTVLILIAAMSLNIAACGNTPKEEKKAQTETAATETAGTEVTGDSADTENRLNELWEEESAIMEENMELWEKVINNMDKDKAMSDENYNYVDALVETIESMKDEVTDEEYNTLMTGAERIKEIETEMAKLQGQMNDETVTEAEETGSEKFPAFNGKDFDGNDVDESIFSQYAVTVVNFWFNGCAPCVAELPELNSLNESLAEKGGTVIGINSRRLMEMQISLRRQRRL